MSLSDNYFDTTQPHEPTPPVQDTLDRPVRILVVCNTITDAEQFDAKLQGSKYFSHKQPVMLPGPTSQYRLTYVLKNGCYTEEYDVLIQPCVDEIAEDYYDRIRFIGKNLDEDYTKALVSKLKGCDDMVFPVSLCDKDECVSVEPTGWVVEDVPASTENYSHYFKDVSNLDTIDIYRVLSLYEVSDPCIQHAIKKLLCSGKRGVKDTTKDVTEAIVSLNRYLEMREEDGTTI